MDFCITTKVIHTKSNYGQVAHNLRNITYRFVLLLVLFNHIININLSAQPAKIDSLILKLNKTADLPDKVKIYNKICLHFTGKDPKKALLYGRDGLELARRIDNKIGIAMSSFRLGTVYYVSGNYSLALKLFSQSLKIADVLNNREIKANVYNNTGLIYRAQNNNQKALEYFFRSLEIHQKSPDSTILIAPYTNLGDIYEATGQYDNSEIYYNKAYKIAKNTNHFRGLAFAQTGLANLYAIKKDHKKATELYLSGLANREKINDIYGKINSYANLAKYYLSRKNYELAEEYANLMLEKSKEQNYKEAYKNSLQILHKIYAATNKFDRAYSTVLQTIELQDSLRSNETTKLILQYEILADYNKKKQNEVLTKNNEKIISQAEVARVQLHQKFLIFAILYLLIAVLIYIWSYRLILKKNKILELQKQQINEKNNKIKQVSTEIAIQEKKIITQHTKLKKQTQIIKTQHDKIQTHENYFLNELNNASYVQKAATSLKLDTPVT